MAISGPNVELASSVWSEVDLICSCVKLPCCANITKWTYSFKAFTKEIKCHADVLKVRATFCQVSLYHYAIVGTSSWNSHTSMDEDMSSILPQS